MPRKIVLKWKSPKPQAYFGWQNNNVALLSLKEGYKNGADNLVRFALREGAKGHMRTLDTYIYSIISLYSYSIEISLKQIYFKLFGETPTGCNDLINLWNRIEETITSSLNNPDFIQDTINCKKTFILYSFDYLNFDEIQQILSELQFSNEKVKALETFLDKDKNNVIYFNDREFIDYVALKENVGKVYEALDNIYFIVEDYWVRDLCD